MKNLIKAFILLSLLGLTACSSKQAYQGLQYGQKNQCQKYQLNQDVYQRCLSGQNVSYEEYERRRDELKTNPNAD